jgi:nucleoside-diphosphate-sugar epimerase
MRVFSVVEVEASAFWEIAKTPVVGAVNVGSSHPVSVASIAERLGDLLGRRELLRFGVRDAASDDPPFLVAGTDRLWNEVGWRPLYDLDSGLAHTLNWWRSHSGRRR